ncbi:MAG: sigma-70 family RNA polymerase sigma factor [Actinomycetota bacterium]|nr:sigma-70 family RNA polymerase sigma factor [Actinomycetota bacterium]
MARWESMLDELVRDRGRALVGYAFLLCGDSSEAEDLVQDALVKTFAGRLSADAVLSAEAYVKRAILTIYLDGFRRRKHWATIRHLSAAPEVHGARTETLVTDRMHVFQALGSLAPRERACVVLRFYEDMTVRQIADHLSLSQGTVKRYLSDAIHSLEQTLGPVQHELVEEFETTPVQGRRAR